jgi:hypothetical protein
MSEVTESTVIESNSNHVSPLTVADLGFRNFIKDKQGNIIGSNGEKCQPAISIPFEQFNRSLEPGRKSRTVPYSGHQILHGIHKRIAEKTGQEYQFGQVFVYRDSMSHPGFVNKATPEANQILLPTTTIDNLVFERFIGTVDLIGNADMNLRLAVKYEEDKFEMALGTNVKVCENFNIFGGKREMTQRGITYEKLMENLEEWLSDVEGQFNQDLKTIAELASRPIDRQEGHRLIGEMMERYHEPKETVMQVTDITRFAEKFHTKPVNSLWDFTQLGTEVIRFDDNSGNAVLENIQKWNDFVISKI